MSSTHEKYEYAIDTLGLSEEEITYIDSIQVISTYPKGKILLSEGQIATKNFYVVAGCVRKYHLKDGEEKTTDFFLEEDSISTSPSRGHHAKSKYFLECLEETTLKVITLEQEEQLYLKFPKFQSMCRISTEKKLEEYQDMLSEFISSSPEERYLRLQETRPDLMNRVPQYQLASYLGVKPESLSRIRKRLTS